MQDACTSITFEAPEEKNRESRHLRVDVQFGCRNDNQSCQKDYTQRTMFTQIGFNVFEHRNNGEPKILQTSVLNLRFIFFCT